MSTAGPFARYSNSLVKSCVDNKTHYTDITGENHWVKGLIDRFHDKAALDGTRIIPSCGYDSIPSDLGVLLLQKNSLKKYEKLFNYKVVKPEPLIKSKKIVSSSLIRNLLEKGLLDKANNLLKRYWTIQGVVKKGRQVGKKIGFPTCNIDIGDYVLAKPGVYAVKVLRKNSKKYLKGIANLGYRPTFNQKKILLEVHLFNFSGNLYNKLLSVEFLKFIRKEKKFNNVNQLRAQIKKDLNIAKKTK